MGIAVRIDEIKLELARDGWMDAVGSASGDDVRENGAGIPPEWVVVGDIA